MPLSEDAIYAALRQVHDPELYINVVDLGLIYEVAVTPTSDRADVHVRMTMTSPACPAGPQLVQDVKDVLGTLEDVGKISVEVTLSPPWTPDRMTDEARDELGMY
jgi:metal-sulfur cluster biosynthetic enzyme